LESFGNAHKRKRCCRETVNFVDRSGYRGHGVLKERMERNCNFKYNLKDFTYRFGIKFNIIHKCILGGHFLMLVKACSEFL
jgi:hypothetical protein